VVMELSGGFVRLCCDGGGGVCCGEVVVGGGVMEDVVALGMYYSLVSL
jgi:hypothetical protein